MPDNPFSAIAQAFYTPKLNAVGVDSQGNYVDADGKPTSLYTQPGWFERAFNPEAQQIQSMNVQGSAQGLEAQKQAAIQRGLIGSQVDNMPAGSNPFGSSFSAVPTDGTDGPINTAPMARNAWINSIIDPALAPTNLKPQVEAGSALGTGLIAPTGANNALSQFATSDYNKRIAQAQQGAAPTDALSILAEANNRLAQDVGITPLELQHQRNVLGAQVSQDQVEAQINKNLNQAKLTQSNVASKDAGINAGTQHNQDIVSNIQSSRMSPFSFFTDRVNPDGSVSAPSRDPLGQSPMQAQMNMASGLYGSGGIISAANSGGGGQMFNAPKQNYVMPAQPVSELPTTLNYDQNSSTQEPLGSSNLVPPHIQQIQDSKDADHNAAQASINAKIATLKSEQKQLQAQHQHTSLIPSLIRNVGLMGQAINQTYVGDPAAQLGSMTSGLHPVDALGRAYNNTANYLWR